MPLFCHSTRKTRGGKEEILTLHLVTVGRLSRLRCGETGAVAEEAALAWRLGLVQSTLCLDACPQWT